jgi:uncharacterized protein YbjT (DUF2867 family)
MDIALIGGHGKVALLAAPLLVEAGHTVHSVIRNPEHVASMDAAERVGATRYVMVSYFGASLDHGVPEDNPFHTYAEAKARADEHLRGTGLDWTILGPSGLTLEEPTGRIDTGATESGTVSRGNVARTIVAALAAPGTVGKFITYNDGDQEIGEAFAAAH